MKKRERRNFRSHNIQGAPRGRRAESGIQLYPYIYIHTHCILLYTYLFYTLKVSLYFRFFFQIACVMNKNSFIYIRVYILSYYYLSRNSCSRLCSSIFLWGFCRCCICCTKRKLAEDELLYAFSTLTLAW